MLPGSFGFRRSAVGVWFAAVGWRECVRGSGGGTPVRGGAGGCRGDQHRFRGDQKDWVASNIDFGSKLAFGAQKRILGDKNLRLVHSIDLQAFVTYCWCHR